MADLGERTERIVHELRANNLDALVCALPANVLLLSGYWPVVGTGIAIVTREGATDILAPDDERELAERGWGELTTFRAGSMENLLPVTDMIRQPLQQLGAKLDLTHARLGYEAGELFEPSSYASMHLYGDAMATLLGKVFPQATLIAAGPIIGRLKAVKTANEIARIRIACQVAGGAFQTGATLLTPGATEAEIANAFQSPLSATGIGYEGTARADGFVYCMSGPNSAAAFGAYARSRIRPIGPSEPILIHCNSYADGHWTDITRTFCFGEVPPDLRLIYDAVLAARQAALAAIGVGARAADVDKAARDTLTASGYGKEFKHGTGHGVGFAAINHLARPCIHPASNDVLETGNVFNIEPAVYIDGIGGIRHCDVVALTDNGVEVLTPFQTELEDLLRGSPLPGR